MEEAGTEERLRKLGLEAEVQSTRIITCTPAKHRVQALIAKLEPELVDMVFCAQCGDRLPPV